MSREALEAGPFVYCDVQVWAIRTPGTRQAALAGRPVRAEEAKGRLRVPCVRRAGAPRQAVQAHACSLSSLAVMPGS